MKKLQKKHYLRLLKLDRYTDGSCPDSNYLSQLDILVREIRWYRERYESRSQRRLSERKWAYRHKLESAYNIGV